MMPYHQLSEFTYQRFNRLKLSLEFHENLTADQLEEFIEFVDWDRVPTHLITDELRLRFPTLHGNIMAGLIVRHLMQNFPG